MRTHQENHGRLPRVRYNTLEVMYLLMLLSLFVVIFFRSRITGGINSIL